MIPHPKVRYPDSLLKTKLSQTFRHKVSHRTSTDVYAKPLQFITASIKVNEKPLREEVSDCHHSFVANTAQSAFAVAGKAATHRSR